MMRQHPRFVRDHNRSLILRLIKDRPGISRSEIKAEIGLTEAAVSRITRELIDAHLLDEGGEIVEAASRPGRRNIGLSVEPQGAFALAACLTLYEKRLSLINLEGRSLASCGLTTVMKRSGEGLVDGLVKEAKKIIQRSGASRDRLLGMAVVSAGAIDYHRGAMTASSLPNLVDVPLQDLLEDRLDCPVRLENVGNALNIAEIQANAQTSRAGVSLLIHAALGIGSSLVIDGQPHHSAHDERMIGHIKVQGAKDVCSCGARGCLNTLVAGRALLRKFSGLPARGTRASGCSSQSEADELTRLVEMANGNDRKINTTLEQAGVLLGETLFSVCAAARPERVILAGPLPQAAAFAAGVSHGLTSSYARSGYEAPRLQLSDIGYGRATEIFALEEFLFNVPSAVRRLLAHA